jgi:uncharacterized protein with FMN-binding domain
MTPIIKYYINMKTNLIIACFCVTQLTLLAQWPVNNGTQGNITGTIGEVRPAGSIGTRIHTGTDCTGNSTAVYSVQADIISTIAPSDAFNSNILMRSGIQYFHVKILTSIAKNAAEINDINKGVKLVSLTQGQEFAQMVVERNWPTHVHILNRNYNNFLLNGFGVAGFQLTDNAIPVFGTNKIALYKDINTNTIWNNPGVPFAKDVPLGMHIIWGAVDIVANVYQPGISSAGTAQANKLAPYKMGYSLYDVEANSMAYQDFERIKFDQGLAASTQVYQTIHARSSTSANPHFIVTNQYTNQTAVDDKLATEKYKDGDYEITVRAGGARATSAEEKLKVRIDNYKNYIQKVEISDTKGLVKYFAEWSERT